MNVQVQNHTVYFEKQGQGEPVLFLHGNPDSAAMWSEIITRMQDEFLCIAPDLPGYGRSAFNPNFDTSLDGMAEWVDQFVTAAGITEPAHLVMHDFGGHFGLAWAIRHPDKVRSITVSNTNFFSDYEWHPVAKLLKTPLLGEFIQMIYRGSIMVNQFKKDAPHLTPEHVQRTTELYTNNARKMALKLYRATESSRFKGWEDRLLEVMGQVPSIVIWGDRDAFAPVALAERFGARNVHHHPEYGHWVMAEAPDVVAEQIKAVCEKARASVAR